MVGRVFSRSRATFIVDLGQRALLGLKSEFGGSLDDVSSNEG